MNVDLRTAQPQAADARLPLSDRARKVLDALLHFAHRDLSWPMPKDVAARLGVSVDTVGRGIDELKEKGYLEWSGLRNGKARVYRLLPASGVESPQAVVESPQAAVKVPTAGVPVGDPAAVTLQHPVSPQPNDEDSRRDEEFDNWQWSPELLDEYAARARAYCLELGPPVGETEFAGAGECEECFETVAWRTVCGMFALCRGCRRRRAAVALRLGSQKVVAEEAS